MNILQDVKVFHEVFNHPIAETPVLIDEKRFKDRTDWTLSEIKEMQDAYKAKDIIEVADALADAIYFLGGSIIEFGLADLFPRIFTEVQRSNMSKICKNLTEAEMTISKYESEGIKCHYIPKHILHNQDRILVYLIVRTSDGKTLKSINWSPPDLSFINDGKEKEHVQL